MREMKFLEEIMAGQFYPDNFIEDVRSSNDIVEVISEHVKLEKRGNRYFGLCPFHREKTPSFSVTASRQFFYCYGCQKGGTVIHFIMELEGLEFGDTIKYLAQRAGNAVPEFKGGGNDRDSEIKKEIVQPKRRL